MLETSNVVNVMIMNWQAQEACGAQEIDNALDMIKALEDQLEEIRKTADNNKLLPLPGESVRQHLSLFAHCLEIFSALSSLVFYTKWNRGLHPTGDYCPSVVKVPGLNEYTNAQCVYACSLFFSCLTWPLRKNLLGLKRKAININFA